MERVIVIRFGELFLKGKNRDQDGGRRDGGRPRGNARPSNQADAEFPPGPEVRGRDERMFRGEQPIFSVSLSSGRERRFPPFPA